MPQPPTVFGEPATELMLLMKQGEHAWLMRADTSNQEFSKVFWFTKDGETGYRLRDGYGKFGESTLLNCALDAAGCLLTWSCGRKTWIPQSWYSYTWR